ncbi:MAG: AAA family ATPase [Thermoplasmata archaeon HGW-Thermoplasmata-2]|nr:MAG: AAA family ATPase [Thermoplasmata archaeon HGW-Thermoplasmata-2]
MPHASILIPHYSSLIPTTISSREPRISNPSILTPHPSPLTTHPSLLASDWTERYRPKSLGEIVGNGEAVSELNAWADGWDKGQAKKKCAILMGTPGCGKTSAALALAADRKWTVIELNASDVRSGDRIRHIALTGAVNETFTEDGTFVSTLTGKHKLILMDEADNLYERGGAADSGFLDKGGKRAIVDMIKETRQPIILIVNDYYALTSGSGRELNSLCLQIKFRKVDRRTTIKALHKICIIEGIEAAPEVLEGIADRAEGDLRSAVRDLQTLATGRTKIAADDLKSLGYRDREGNIWEAMRKILKGSSFDEARNSTRNLDETPEGISMWLDENIPLEYKEPEDVERAYNWLSRADIFMGRVFRRQHYALWGYASAVMTGGVALSKSRPYHGFVKYQSPNMANGWIGKMSRSKGMRQVRNGICEKLSEMTHNSKKEARREILPAVKYLFASDWGFSISMTKKLELDDEEVAFLLDEDADSLKVKRIFDEIRSMEKQRAKGEAKAANSGAPEQGAGDMRSSGAQICAILGMAQKPCAGSVPAKQARESSTAARQHVEKQREERQHKERETPKSRKSLGRFAEPEEAKQDEGKAQKSKKEFSQKGLAEF